MKVIGKIKAVLGLDTKRYQKGINKAQKKTKSFGNSIKKIGGLMAGAFAFKKVVDFGKQVVNAANKQIQAEQKLKTAIKANGKAVDSTFESHAAFASQLQKETTVGDETTLMLLQMAESMSSSAPQEAAKGAIALSKAYDMNLQAALKGVTRAQEGDFQMLQRYIPSIKTAGTEAKKYAEYQKALANGYEVAKAEAESGLGPLDQLNNAWGDLQEVIGEKILPYLQDFADWGKKAVAWIEDNITAIIKWAKILGRAAAALVGVKIAMIAVNTVMAANPIGAIVTALALLITGLVSAWEESAKFRAMIKYATQSAVASFKKLWIRIKQYSKAAWDAIKTYFGAGLKILKGFGKAIIYVLKGQFGKAKDAVADAFGGIVDDFKNIGKKAAQEANKEISKIDSPDYKEILGNERALQMAKDAGYDSVEAWRDGIDKGLKDNRDVGVKAGKQYAKGMKEGYTMESLTSGGIKTDAETPETKAPIMRNDEELNMKSKLEEQKKALQETYNSMMPILGEFQNAFMAAFTTPSGKMSAFISSLSDFVKQFLMKVASMIAATAALAAILAATGLGTALGMKGGFSGMFEGLSGGGIGSIMSGAVGMAGGGIVPGGYPNDSYPAMLTSGETVIPPNKLPQTGGEELVTRLRGRDIDVVLQRWNKDKSRI